MRPPVLVFSLITLLAAAAVPACAAPLFGGDDLQRNGVVSRHLWKPDFAAVEAGGLRFSAGVALGIRGALQTQLGRRATPMLTMELNPRSSVSLLPGDGGGAMLVLQTAP